MTNIICCVPEMSKKAVGVKRLISTVNITRIRHSRPTPATGRLSLVTGEMEKWVGLGLFVCLRFFLVFWLVSWLVG